MQAWHVYFVRTRHGSLYTGIATDVARRMKEHDRSPDRGAKYLRGRGPLEVVFQRRIGSQALALRVEHRVKRLSKRKKEEIVHANLDARGLLDLLALRPRRGDPVGTKAARWVPEAR